jgi:hypothetical protein
VVARVSRNGETLYLILSDKDVIHEPDHHAERDRRCEDRRDKELLVEAKPVATTADVAITDATERSTPPPKIASTPRLNNPKTALASRSTLFCHARISRIPATTGLKPRIAIATRSPAEWLDRERFRAVRRRSVGISGRV